MTDLLKRLEIFVRSEAEAQYAALIQQWSHPLAERIAKGWAIEGLSVAKFNEKDQILRMSCDRNESRFREGDLVILHQNAPNDPNALHLELLYDGETELEFSFIKGNLQFLFKNPTSWILDQDWFDSSPFYLFALHSVANSLRGRSIILPLLQNTLTPKIDFARYERVGQELGQYGMNENQVEAVAQAYATDLLHLIQGPPGTGKTWVLAHLARMLVEDGQRVLVTALTHRAIHNALNKIASLDNHIPVCKIGPQRHLEDLRVPCFEKFTDSPVSDLANGYIIGATPFAIQSQRLNNVEFDVVLFDEASQVTLPLAIMGMLAGNKYIFIGDENQLPPITASFEQTATQASIFSFLAGRGNETMLEITYRLNAELSEWPSKIFYANRLKPSTEAATRRLSLSQAQTEWDSVLTPNKPVIFVDLCHYNTTTILAL